MNVAILGGQGQVGTSLVQSFKLTKSSAVKTFSHKEIDVTFPSEITYESLKNFKPDIIINCAAFTHVDNAEKERVLATNVNGHALKNLAEASNRLNSKIIHISTDYVFGNTQSHPFKETDPTNPLCVYGESKLLGEQMLQEHCDNFAIIRTSWIYSQYSQNFFNTVRRLYDSIPEMKVVNDQIGSPCYANDLAFFISLFCEKTRGDKVNQIFHYSNEGSCSWYDLALAISKKLGGKLKVTPIQSSEYNSLAVRPNYSVLDKSKVKEQFKIEVPHWTEALNLFFKTIES